MVVLALSLGPNRHRDRQAGNCCAIASRLARNLNSDASGAQTIRKKIHHPGTRLADHQVSASPDEIFGGHSRTWMNSRLRQRPCDPARLRTPLFLKVVARASKKRHNVPVPDDTRRSSRNCSCISLSVLFGPASTRRGPTGNPWGIELGALRLALTTQARSRNGKSSARRVAQMGERLVAMRRSAV
jgi:hypothetical protein